MKPSVTAGLKLLHYWWSIAIGGAAGSLTSYFQQVGLSTNMSQVDWHKIGQLAIGGAVVAMVFHMTPPPSEKK